MKVIGKAMISNRLCIMSMSLPVVLGICFVFLSNIPSAKCIPTMVTWDMMAGMEGTPVLGRGYSLSVNSFQSTCLQVEPYNGKNGTVSGNSYTFDSFSTDFTRTEPLDQILTGKITKFFSYNKIKATIVNTIDMNMNSNHNQNQKKRYHYAITYRAEGISKALLDTHISLIPEAVDMLNNEDFIGFFMTCGPKYINAIHRAQEVTALFSFDAYEQSSAQSLAKTLHKYVHGLARKYKDEIRTFKFYQYSDDYDRGIHKDMLDSLTIELFAYGLALNPEGTETLVATSLDEFHQVIHYALNSIGRSIGNSHYDDHHPQTGMISAFEAVPWHDNPTFLNVANLDYTSFPVLIPYSVLDQAENGKCDLGLEMDDNSKCCESHSILKVDELGLPAKYKTCQVYNQLTTGEVTGTLETNAEFVVRLGSVVKEKMKSITTLGQCVNTLKSYPKKFDYSFLHALDKKTYNYDAEMKLTVKEMKAALDPTEDLKILSIIGREQDEYYEMFYQPCLAALYGRNRGNDKEMDPRYFFVDPWYKHEECSRKRCLDHADMAWDRNNGNGCVDGILGRKGLNVNSVNDEDEDQYCATTMDKSSGHISCKHSPDTLTLHQIDLCREKIVNNTEKDFVSLSYLMDIFCMPQLALNEAQADMTRMDHVDFVWDICSSGEEFPYCDVNVTGIDRDWLHDGLCDAPFNIETCEFDGHDCDDFNSQYPDCEVDYPYLIGNGNCDGKNYNTEACGFDGNDCNKFNRKYPNCVVDHPHLVGNGFCDGGDYNTKACDYDGGDCDDLVNV